MAHAARPYQLVPAEVPPQGGSGAGPRAATPVRVVSRDDRVYLQRA